MHVYSAKAVLMRAVLVAFAFIAGACPTFAVISVGAGGSSITYTFDTDPDAADWSTRSLGTDGAQIETIAALDAAVQTNVATAITIPLPNSGTVPPSLHGLARWNNTGRYIQTRPTTNAATLLMATLRNDSGGPISTLAVAYDMNRQSAAAEVIAGHRVYFSQSGAGGSWTLVPELYTATPGPLQGILNLGSWANGATLYVLWADDNADVVQDPSYTIDNARFFIPPTGIQITTPTNNQAFAYGVPITITVVGSLQGMITNVDFFADGVPIGNQTAAPFSIIYSNADLGAHTLEATAYDNLGNFANASVVQIMVNPNSPPIVTINSPANGASFFVGTNITNSVTVSDSDGIVTRVEFYVNNALYTVDATSPYACELGNVTAGVHSISAVALDDGGIAGTNTVSITVTNPPNVTILISNAQAWKYLDNGTDPGPTWTTLGFSDAGWSNGIAELGYGDAPARPERTVMSFGPSASNKYATTFFRRTFNVVDPAAYGRLIVRVLRDDGAIVYINGVEVLRNNITNDVVTYLTYTDPLLADDDGTVYQQTNASPTVLRAGQNVVAVEIHQESETSSDISFDLMLWALPPGPRLTITPVSATEVEITWPVAGSGGYVLRSGTNANTPGNWANVSEPDNVSGGLHHVRVSTSIASPRFFRLANP